LRVRKGVHFGVAVRRDHGIIGSKRARACGAYSSAVARGRLRRIHLGLHRLEMPVDPTVAFGNLL
jgi:hypothetical protein